MSDVLRRLVSELRISLFQQMEIELSPETLKFMYHIQINTEIDEQHTIISIELSPYNNHNDIVTIASIDLGPIDILTYKDGNRSTGLLIDITIENLKAASMSYEYPELFIYDNPDKLTKGMAISKKLQLMEADYNDDHRYDFFNFREFLISLDTVTLNHITRIHYLQETYAGYTCILMKFDDFLLYLKETTVDDLIDVFKSSSDHIRKIDDLDELHDVANYPYIVEEPTLVDIVRGYMAKRKLTIPSMVVHEQSFKRNGFLRVVK